MSNNTSPALPAFSYAQAARGLNPARVAQQNSAQSSATPSEKGSKDRRSSTQEVSNLELNPKPSDPLRDEAQQPESSKDSPSAETTSPTNINPDKENVPPTSAAVRPQHETKHVESPVSSALDTKSSSVSLKAEDHTTTPNGMSDSWERESQVSTAVEKSSQTVDKAKTKDADEDWDKVSAANSFDKELKAAPVPTINIWQQRKEAQDAKLREQAATRASTVVASIKTKAKPDATEVTKRQSVDKASSTVDSDNTASKKTMDSSKGMNEGRRESGKAQHIRPTSKDGPTSELLPPPPAVGDAVSWPTPDTAGLDDRRKSAGPDKMEKLEPKPSTGKKWERVPFVPTVKFETTLPPVARRGGRPGPRGRDGNARGGHAAQHSVSADKSEAIGTMGPPPPRQSHEQERGRKHDTSRNERSNSVPTQSRKSVSASGMHGGSRHVPEFSAKPDRNVSDHGNKVSTVGTQATTSADNNQAAATDASVSSSRHTEHVVAGPYSTRHEGRKSSMVPDEEPVPSDGRGGRFGRSTRESTRDAPASRPREYRRDQSESESSRDKVESWRDRETQPENNTTTRREHRSERGRGSYRGRGNFGTYHVPLGNQAMSAPLPQQPFSATSRSYSNNEGRRQSSQPYPYMQSISNSRGVPRSQSIPVGGVPQSMTQPLAPLQTDFNMYPYPLMHPGIMSAMPYNPALDTLALYSMVSTQLDYYFSIDNLCKDIFLRSNMDSQGYMPLSVVANFKRMKSLTDDMDLLRHACSQSRNIEFRPGENGDDLVRRRGDWNQWILPNLIDRQAFARHDGPAAEVHHSPVGGQNDQLHADESSLDEPSQMRTMHDWAHHAYHGASVFVPPPIPQAGFSTLDSHVSESPISATEPATTSGHRQTNADDRHDATGSASMRSPPAHEVNGTGSRHLSNGSHSSAPPAEADDENVFPDDQIPTLYVYKREEPGAVPTERPPFIGNAGRTPSQSLRNERENSEDCSQEQVPGNFVTGLRGGAASPGQLEHLSKLPANVAARDGTGIFWLKDGISQHDFDAQGSIPWLYQSIRARAAAQRISGYVNSDLDLLYQFWSGFLVDNFNASMYADFHTLAVEDFQLGMTGGSTHLATFYGNLLARDKPLSDRIAYDIVQLAAVESGEHRPTFHKLRSAWRNGAFSLKSRKKIDKILDPAFRAELEK